MTPQPPDLANPQNPTWQQFSAGLPADVPDSAYDGLRERFFNQYVAPDVLRQGHGLETIHKQFMDATERYGKSAMPRTEMVAKQALASLVAPFDSTLSRGAQGAADEQARETARQAINPAPYQMLGSAIGEVPYWVEGMKTAETASKALKADYWLDKAIKTAAGGLIQGTYDMGKTGSFVEGIKGAQSGAAMTAGVEALGPLKNFLTTGGLEPRAAAAVEQLAKGAASPQEEKAAVDAVLGNERVDQKIQQYTQQQVKNSQAAGAPQSSTATPKSTKTKPPLSVSIRGADGQVYNLFAPKTNGQMDLIADHLQNGGSILDIKGTPGQQSNFYQALSALMPEKFDIDVPLKGNGKVTLPTMNDEIAPKETPANETLQRLQSVIQSKGGASIFDSAGLKGQDAQKLISQGLAKGFVYETTADGQVAFGHPELVNRLMRASSAKAGMDANALINARNSYYHATDLEGFRGILDAGHIRVGENLPEDISLVDTDLAASDKEAAITNFMTETGTERSQAENTVERALAQNYAGVSVSRVPRLMSKEDKAITFVIDANKMPRSRPYVEEGFGKTTEPAGTLGEYAHSSELPAWKKEIADQSTGYADYIRRLHEEGELENERNPTFEFEQRTYNEPIPLSAVKGVIVDKEALHDPESFDQPEQFRQAVNNRIQDIQNLAQQAGLKVKVMESGRQVHSYRAGLAREPEDMRWGMSIPLSDQLEALPTGQVRNGLTGQVFDNASDAVTGLPTNEKANATELIRGSANMPLDDRGMQTVDHLGERLAAKGGLDSLYSSDTIRTQQTAHAIMRHDPYVQLQDVTPHMQSWGSGSLEGAIHTPEITDWKAQLVRDFPDHQIGGMGVQSTRPGESFNDFKGRVLPYVKNLVEQFESDPTQKIGVVTHYSPIRAIEGWLKSGMPDDFSLNPNDYLRERTQPAGVYKMAPNDQGVWKMKKVNIDNNQQLTPGIYLIRHGETAWNKGGEEALAAGKAASTAREVSLDPREVSYKERPLAHRFYGNIPQELLPGEAEAVTLPAGEGNKPSIFYREVNKELIFHENLHAHYNYLGIDGWLNQQFDDPIVRQIFNGAFSPEAKDLYGGKAWIPEEVFNYAASAVRVGNEDLLEKFGEADTSKEHVLNWTSDTSKAILDKTASAADSVHKRVLERRLNAVVTRATDSLEDIRKPYAPTDLEIGIDNGQYSVKDGSSTSYFSSRQEMAEHLDEQFQEPLQVPELVPTQYLPDDVPRYGMKVNAPSGKVPITTEPLPEELADKPVKVGPLPFSFIARPFWDWLSTASVKLNHPALYSAFDTVNTKILQYNNQLRPYQNTFREAIDQFKGKQSDLFKWLQDPAQRAFTEQQLRFTPDQIKTAQKVEAHLFEDFPELKDYMQNITPKLKAANYNPELVWRNQGKGQGLMPELVFAGRIDPRDESFTRIASAYVRSRLHRDIVEPDLSAAEDLVNEKREDGSYRLGQLAPLLRRQVGYLRGTYDQTAQAIGGALGAAIETINSGLESVNKHLPDGLQIPTIETPANELLQKYVMFSYAGAMAARPGVLARAALQTFITGFPLYGHYITRGMARAFEASRSGGGDALAVAERYGAIIEKGSMQEMMAGGAESGWEEDLADKALRMIQWSHNSSRLISFWAHTEKALDALVEHGRDPETFVKKSDLWFMPQRMREKYLRELPHISPDMYEDFSRRIGADLTGLTQWNYQKGATPGLYKWQLGRLFGQYGTWPLNYIEYARRYLQGADRGEMMKALTRLTIAHGAILGAGMGGGIDTSDWVFFHPMAYGGGPLLQSVVNLPTAMGDWSSPKGTEARHDILEMINPLDMLPGSEEVYQVWKAASSNDPNIMIRMMGFKPLEK